jgi:hypothetical protein
MRLALLVAIIALPAAASAAPRTFSELAETMVQFLNAGITTAIILGLVIYFYGIATGLTNLRSGGTEELRKRIVWGLIALFVMVSVWGIVGLVRNSLFGGGGGGGDFGGGPQEFDCIAAECLGR